MNKDDKELKLLRRKLDSNLLNYVRTVFKAQLKETDDSYTIGYGPDWRDESELHPSVMRELGARVYLVDKQRSDQPLHLILALTEKLGEIFVNFDTPPFLHVVLQDNGDDFITISDDEDVVIFERCSPLYFNNKNSPRLEEFIQTVEKYMMFTTIKYS